MQERLHAGGGNLDVPEESTDPRRQDPEHDEHKQRRSDAVHDLLEVPAVLSALDQAGSLAHERVPRRGLDDGVGLASLAASGVEHHVSHETIHSERLTGDGGLVAGYQGQAVVNRPRVVIVAVLGLLASALLVTGTLIDIGGRVSIELVLVLEVLELVVVLGAGIVTDQLAVGGDTPALLEDDNVAGDKLPRKDFLLLAIADNSGPHGDVALQAGDNIGRLLFLIIPDGGIEEENANNDTKVDPVLQTDSKECGDFHDWRGNVRTQSHAHDGVMMLQRSLSSALTVENGALEEAHEFPERVLLLGSKLIPAETSASFLDIVVADALSHVCVEPCIGCDEVLVLLDLKVAAEQQLEK